MKTVAQSVMQNDGQFYPEELPNVNKNACWTAYTIVYKRRREFLPTNTLKDELSLAIYIARNDWLLSVFGGKSSQTIKLWSLSLLLFWQLAAYCET